MPVGNENLQPAKSDLSSRINHQTESGVQHLRKLERGLLCRIVRLVDRCHKILPWTVWYEARVETELDTHSDILPLCLPALFNI